jgi:transposase, IS5 family
MERPFKQLGFVDQLVGAGRSRSDRFFAQVEAAIDWRPFEEMLRVIRSSPRGQPGFPALMLFKILLLQAWYDLGDPATEDALNDRKSFARFVGLRLDEKAPDHSVIWRFREELSRKGLLAALMEELVRQTDKAGLIVRQGTLMDATFVPSAARPPSAPPKEEQKKAAGAPRSASKKKQKNKTKPDALYAEGKRSLVDPDARWARKGRQVVFGYKLHISVDADHRIVRRAKLTAANVNDCEIGPELVCPDSGDHYGDKAYGCQKLFAALKAHGLGDGIMQRPNKHHPLTPAERRRNKWLTPIRAGIEGVFGEKKSRLGLKRAKYFGLRRVQAQCDLIAMAFNLKTLALA